MISGNEILVRKWQSDPVNALNQMSSAMWIPTPIYESLPYVYVLGGVMFISGTLYIGLNAPGAPLYIGCGLVSIVYGAFIFARRRAYRNLNQTGQFDLGAINPAKD